MKRTAEHRRQLPSPWFVAMGWVCSSGCAASGADLSAQQADTRWTSSTLDDESRCEFQGRLDREVAESVGNGATRPSIRRVYFLAKDGERTRGNLQCREVDTNGDGIKDVVRFYDNEGRKSRERADSNFDGKPDTWIRFAKGRVVRVELDRTGDGKIEETRFYLKGKLSRIQLDSNGDGKADVWEMYSHGRLDRMGEDLDFDGRVDRWSRDEDQESASEEAAEPETSKRSNAVDS